jgi:hypothetical protein
MVTQDWIQNPTVDTRQPSHTFCSSSQRSAVLCVPYLSFGVVAVTFTTITRHDDGFQHSTVIVFGTDSWKFGSLGVGGGIHGTHAYHSTTMSNQNHWKLTTPSLFFHGGEYVGMGDIWWEQQEACANPVMVLRANWLTRNFDFSVIIWNCLFLSC